MVFAVFIKTGALCSSNAVERKQPKVKAATTLSVNANIVFALDKKVFMFGKRVGYFSLTRVFTGSQRMLQKCRKSMSWIPVIPQSSSSLDLTRQASPHAYFHLFLDLLCLLLCLFMRLTQIINMLMSVSDKIR